MSRKYKIQDQSQPHFVTFTVIHWLDVFIRKEYRDIFLDSIRYCQKQKGLEVYEYCMMSSHIHMMIGRNGTGKMEHSASIGEEHQRAVIVSETSLSLLDDLRQLRVVYMPHSSIE